MLRAKSIELIEGHVYDRPFVRSPIFCTNVVVVVVYQFTISNVMVPLGF